MELRSTLAECGEIRTASAPTATAESPANTGNSSPESPWIAPRRSPVRVRLAPLGEPPQPCGFPEAGARSEAPFGVGLWPDLWPGRHANAPLEFVVLRYFMRFRASISAQSRGLNGTFPERSPVRARGDVRGRRALRDGRFLS